MSARCKPGDLAVVVATTTTPEMLGRFVIVERLAAAHEYHSTEPRLVWIIRSAASGDLPSRGRISGILRWNGKRPFDDRLLRPIRPNGGQDETFTWAPTRVELPA